MKCPSCGLENRYDAESCDCGFSFEADDNESKSTIEDNNPQPARQEQKTVEERREYLALLVQESIARGARVDSQDDSMAVIVFGKPVNHILHFFIGVFTFGIWWIVWLILGLTCGERRQLLTVDKYGELSNKAV
jgi:hypothetical protein